MEPRGADRCGADRCGTAQRKAEEICDYEKQLRTLKDEIAVLSAEKSVLQGRSDQFSRIFSLKLLLLSSRLKAWFGRGVWGVWGGGGGGKKASGAQTPRIGKAFNWGGVFF